MVDSVEQGTRTAARRAAPAKADSAKTDGARKVAAQPAAKAETAAPETAVVAKVPVRTPAVRKPKAPAEAAPAPVTIAPENTPTKPAQPAAATQVRSATASLKEYRIMTTIPTTEYVEKFQTAVKEASEKAKAAFEKSQASFGEINEFAKGNVEALVASTKILATGLQEMSKGYLAESKTTLETLTAEMKELAAVKTPAELMEKQTALLRKHFDAAVAASSKNSEAVLKLANEAFQPISTRVSLAVEKVKHAA